jgi:hypothetical protein
MGCAHSLHLASGVVIRQSKSNSPREHVHGILSMPVTTTPVQRPDAIVREKGGVGCSVVLILVAGVLRNGGKQKKEGAMLRK